MATKDNFVLHHIHPNNFPLVLIVHLIEHNSSNPNDLDQVYQIGKFLTIWCSYAEEAIDDLGKLNELILANLTFLYDEKQEERIEKEARRQKKERRRKTKHPRVQSLQLI